jgi:formylglycine-generating enzyme required for sulfatase activity
MTVTHPEPAMSNKIRAPSRISRIASVWLVRSCMVALTGVAVPHSLCAQEIAPAAPAAAPANPDVLRAEIVTALAERRYEDVLRGMAAYRALEAQGVAVPVSLLFAESEAAQALGDWPQAQAALGEYLARAAAADPLYPEALRSYPGIQTKARATAESRARELELAAASEQQAVADRQRAEAAARVDTLVADLVVIPAGQFLMGDGSGRGDADERPARTVNVAAFRLARHEVTFAQFDAFCRATGCTPPDDNGWGRDDRPVINVSWDDAIAYIAWLNQQSDVKFRLPSEAEWEYAARGGRPGDYWWGPAFSPDHANAGGTAGRDEWPGTAPVGQFPPNPFGLHDMNGNVREWVEDCWHVDYSGAPQDAQAWVTGNCERRTLRGGGWSLGPRSLRASDRDWDDRNFRYTDRGFRVAASE